MAMGLIAILTGSCRYLGPATTGHVLSSEGTIEAYGVRAAWPCCMEGVDSFGGIVIS